VAYLRTELDRVRRRHQGHGGAGQRARVPDQRRQGGPARALRGRARAGKKPWQTECGEGYDHGLYLAYNLSADLRHLHPATRRLVLVTVRGDSPQQVTYDLSRFTTTGTTARHWTTDAHPDGTPGQQYAQTPALPVTGKRFSAYSVHTFELDNAIP
jgi:hypothetical protein